MKKVLIIDDDPAIRELFTAVLQDAGYEADTAETGEVGLALKDKNSYSLIFLDYKMPGIDGLETLQKIRDKDRGIQIYMMTSFYGECFNELMKTREKQFHFELLKKPLDPKTITTLARNALG